MTNSPARRALFLLALISCLWSTSGCQLFGFAAQALPRQKEPAKYDGLKGHTVAVMAWAPSGIQIDWPDLRLDVATGVQTKLLTAQRKDKLLPGTRFPQQPSSVVRFQDDYPDTEGEPIAKVAPRLAVERVIYIEIDNLQTRADNEVELFRGVMSGAVKVVEVSDGVGKEVFNEPGIAVIFPPSAPEEGVPDVNDAVIYRGALDAFTTQVVNRFVEHEAPEK